MKRRPIILIALLIFSLTLGALVYYFGSAEPAQAELALAPESALPDFVHDMPPQVQEAYRFAMANPEVLRQIPCYCGCGGMGHGNNLDCYVAAYESEGQVAEFENHAAY